jgi:hypothetical protein
MLDVIFARTTGGHPGSNACNSLQKERDVAVATSVKQEAHTLQGWEHVTILKAATYYAVDLWANITKKQTPRKHRKGGRDWG